MTTVAETRYFIYPNNKDGCPANNHAPALCFVCDMQYRRDATVRRNRKALAQQKWAQRKAQSA